MRWAVAIIGAVWMTGLACGDRSTTQQDGSSPERRPPNVILITLESLRTDRVGAYGGGSATRPEEPLTPALDAFAREAVVYEDAHSVTSWTLASHASLFTGMYPNVHQTRRATDRLADGYETLAELLRASGYQTAAVVSGPYLRRAHNLSQGFDLYDDSAASVEQVAAHRDVTNPTMDTALQRFIEAERNAERPFFLFAYFWDPHYDYIPPPPWDQRFVPPDAERFDITGFGTTDAIGAETPPARMRYLTAQYEGELRWTDQSLERLRHHLEAKDLWDESLIIVTADHGEEFFDHGEKGHYNNIHAETIHVPLLIKYPAGGPIGRDDRLVSLVDVLPTILDQAGIRIPIDIDGRSLLSPADPERAIYFDLLAEWYSYDDEIGPTSMQKNVKTWTGIRHGRHKLAVHLEAGRELLFDVESDPTERNDLAERQPALARELRSALDGWLELASRRAALHQPGGAAQLSPEERERLRSLGYLR